MPDPNSQWNRLYYDDWVAREGLTLIRGNKVDNVFTVDLKPWARTGGHAVQIQLDGTGDMNGAYVQEIPPGKALEPQRHMYEEMIYVLKGRGSTTVWYDEERKNSFEWQADSLFCIPLNARHRHFNGSGSEPARYVGVTTAPVMMNLIRNEGFMFNNDAVFPERYNERDNYFAANVEMEEFLGWDKPVGVACANFFPSIHAIPMQESSRGRGGQSVTFELANGVLGAHIMQMPGGRFSNVHRHGPGAHVLWLQGEGYTLMWPDGGEKIKEDWGPGTMLVPPSWWWHQHAAVSQEPVQHLALKLSSKRNKVNRLSLGTMLSVRKGGSMMNFEDFPAELMEEVTRIFVDECAKRGTTPNLEAIAGV
ncbi:MAG TPA: cupin domain-containing protein [Chloroflexota bacterium]|nr:cupin domain-containing protein [Chloroflexota bacterium]